MAQTNSSDGHTEMSNDNGGAGHLYLVDGAGYIFRAYHALPPMTRPDGTPVNAVMGFCAMLERLLMELEGPDKPSHLAVIFDAGHITFRNDIYDDYKANRPPPPEDLRPQFPLVKDASRAFNLPTIELDGFEADDIIATFVTKAREAGMTVTIVSSDKDLMQLVGDGVDMLDPMKQRRIGPDEVREKFGVAPDKVIDVQSLTGDSVDNVPGVPGIGVKTASALIEEYGDLDTLLARAAEIKQPKRRQNLIEFAEQARISRELVTLKRDVELDEDVDDLKLPERDIDRLMAFMDEQNFKTLKARIRGRLEGAAANPAPNAASTDEGPKHETIVDDEALAAWIALIQREGVLAVEAMSDHADPMQASLTGLAMAVAPGRAAYLPLGHRVGQHVSSPYRPAPSRETLPWGRTTIALRCVCAPPPMAITAPIHVCSAALAASSPTSCCTWYSHATQLVVRVCTWTARRSTQLTSAVTFPIGTLPTISGWVTSSVPTATTTHVIGWANTAWWPSTTRH